jgi:predicted methyltransferase
LKIRVNTQSIDNSGNSCNMRVNFHDIYNNYGEEGAVGAMGVIYAALKPVGVFGLIDRHGAEGNDNKALHRSLKSDAIRIAEAAGFVVEGESGLAVSLAAPVSTL